VQIASTGGRRLIHAALAAKKLALELGRTVTRKELSTAARGAEKALGLRPAQRLVLSELVACWGEQEWEKLLVWPSNNHLASRTGLNDRSIRRIIVQLADLKLIIAKDSPNGKRFAIRDLAGSIIDAYGFDLTPIYARRGEWTTMLAEQKVMREIRRRAHDEVTVARRATEEALNALAQHSPALDRSDIEDRYNKLLNRTPTRSMAELPAGLLQNWQDLRNLAEEAFHQSGNGGLGVQHKETDNESPSESCTKGLPRKAEVVLPNEVAAEHLTLALIIEACPTVSDYGRLIHTIDDLVGAGRYLRASLGAHESAWNEAVAEIGLVGAATAVIYVLQLYDDDVSSGSQKIRNPGGYFRALVRMVKSGKINLGIELLAMRQNRMTRRVSQKLGRTHMPHKTTTVVPALRDDQTQPDLSPLTDGVLEAEVALPLADFILSLPGARGLASAGWEPIRNRRSAEIPGPALTCAAKKRSGSIPDPPTTS
jgi:replication initiation protein RepC